jgi:mevalonate kinase
LKQAPNLKTVIVKSPAKIILSGEYSILHGAPAIGIAINLYQTTYMGGGNGVNIFSQKEPLLQNIQKEHASFQNFCYALKIFFDIKPDLADIHLMTQSSILRKSGLGSSAAYTVNLLKAFLEFYNVSYSKEMFLKCARYIENWYHGTSSGIDVSLSYLGGNLFFEKENQFLTIKKIDFPLETLNLVFTGKPEANTKRCVSHVQKRFKNDKGLWQEFKNITHGFLNIPFQHHLIRENHRLLSRIGIVPNLIQNFIKEIEQHGGSAKICGAGSIIGNQAGIVWASHIKRDLLKKICQKKGYAYFQLLTVQKDKKGTQVNTL